MRILLFLCFSMISWQLLAKNVCMSDLPMSPESKVIQNKIISGSLDIMSDKFQYLPHSEHKKIYRGLLNKEKIWKDKFNYVLNHYSLEKEQISLLRRAIEILDTPGLYGDDSSYEPTEEVQELVAVFHTQVKKHFSPELSDLVFNTLYLDRAYKEANLISKLDQNLAGNEELIPACNCSPSSNQCANMRCRTGGCKTRPYCGLFWAYTCLGMCSNSVIK